MPTFGRPLARWIAAVLLSAGAVACSSDSDENQTACAPGETRACDCPGSAGGTQLCGADQTFAQCVCSQADAGADADAQDSGTADTPRDAAADPGDGGNDDGRTDIQPDTGSDASDTGTCGAAGEVVGCDSKTAELVCNGATTTSRPCPAGASCTTTANKCVPYTCTPDERRCGGDDAEQCDSFGEAWVTTTCDVTCADGACTCALLPDACPEPSKCSAFQDGNVCRPTAGKVSGEACSTSECARGLICTAVGAGFECRSLCDLQTPSQCVDGERCAALPDQPGLGVCATDPCFDGALNGPETGLDCGGDCPGCADGEVCTAPSDCRSLSCSFGFCQASQCSDGMLNGDETAVDCGGSCGGCATGQACGGDADCFAGTCAMGACVYDASLPRCLDDDPFSAAGSSNHSKDDAAIVTGDNDMYPLTDLELCAGTQDWYRRDELQNGLVLGEITITGGRGTPADVTLTVYDDLRQAVTTGTVSGNRLDFDFTPVASGPYFIQVSSQKSITYEMHLLR